MSWLSELANAAGSAFGYEGVGDSMAGWFDSGTSAGAGTVASSTNQNAGDGFWTSDMAKTLLQSGVGLAGIYYQQSQQKKLAEMAAAQRMAELEAQAKLRGGGGGGGGSNAAKMATLASLYNNYAQLVQKGGSDIMEGAIRTADVATAPIIARIQGLR